MVVGGEQLEEWSLEIKLLTASIAAGLVLDLHLLRLWSGRWLGAGRGLLRIAFLRVDALAARTATGQRQLI